VYQSRYVVAMEMAKQQPVDVIGGSFSCLSPGRKVASQSISNPLSANCRKKQLCRRPPLWKASPQPMTVR
jgi:hypothetical protein